MLRRYLNDLETREVPYANGRYHATLDGKIFSVDETDIVPDKENMVEIFILGAKRKISFDWVMAATFKPMFEAGSFILDWTVARYNGKEDLTYLESLLWIPPPPGQPCMEHPKFNIIPGYSRYSISESGTVWNRESKKYIKTRKSRKKDRNSYVNFNVWADGIKDYGPVIGVHRAIALAWIQYPANVIDLTVNHEDGLKGNNFKSNLSWATYSENNVHALDNNLRQARKEVYVKDYLYNNIKEYESLTRASRAIGIDSGHICGSLTRRPGVLINRRYYLIYKGEPLNWPKVSQEQCKKMISDKIKHTESLFCFGKNAITGKIYVAQTPFDLRTYTGFEKEEQRTALRSKSMWPYKGWYCWKSSKPKTMYKIPKGIAEKISGMVIMTDPIIDYSNPEDIKVYRTIGEIAKDKNLSQSSIARALHLGNGSAEIEGMKLSIFKPSETFVLTPSAI